ncbi:hypothetical protein AMTR_s00035p00240630 [Amborella trichopoda]|uniref:Uncharacterized protein n=1 Tax=Amborella trichopoda TaxID=13333 RepID=W1PPY2_AMBTC|nr:hypothetical protein AMTR_s00035p00240630 [Amborella trichopoda]
MGFQGLTARVVHRNEVGLERVLSKRERHPGRPSQGISFAVVAIECGIAHRSKLLIAVRIVGRDPGAIKLLAAIERIAAARDQCTNLEDPKPMCAEVMVLVTLAKGLIAVSRRN